MAYYNITVNSSEYNVTQNNTINTDCASMYEFEVFANNGDTIDLELLTDNLIDYFFYNGTIILSNGSINSHYISNGVRTDFVNTDTITFNNSLIIKFGLENSGRAGFFNNIDLNITNSTTGQSYNSYTTTLTRENDNNKCGQCCNGTNTNELGLYSPQIFNPDAGEVVAGTIDVTVTYSTDIGLVSINGLVLDDSEYSLVGTTLTITPDNGFNDITDEILVFQNKQ